jgi:hypothetical protein
LGGEPAIDDGVEVIPADSGEPDAPDARRLQMRRGCASAVVGKNAIADTTSKINETSFRTVLPCSVRAILPGLVGYGQSSAISL